jgi:hypothetical protein
MTGQPPTNLERSAYTRPKPPEWDRLHEVAGIVTGLQDPAWDKPVLLSELGHEIDPLSKISLANNQHYTLGHVICKFMQQLADPEMRQQIVKAGAANLVKISGLALSGGISAFDNGFDLDDPFIPAINGAYESTPAAIRLLGNHLIVGYNSRYMNGQYRAISPEVTQTVGSQMRGEQVSAIERMLSTIDTPPQYLLGTILRERGVALDEGEVPSQSQIDDLRDSSIVQVARRLCTLTNEQSVGLGGDNFTVGDKQVEYVAPEVPRPTIFSGRVDTSIEDADPLGSRQTPMVCPALHVQSVIPHVMEMTVDMIDEAREMLKAA